MTRFYIPFLDRFFGTAASADGGPLPVAGEGQLLDHLRQIRNRLEQEKHALGHAMEDISAVKLKEKVAALNDDRKFVRSILESARTPVVAVDLEGHVTYLNACAQKTFGYALADTAGRLYEDLFDAAPDDPVLETLRTGEAFSCRRLAMKAKDNTYPAYIVSTSLLRDDEGSMRGVVAVMENLGAMQAAWNRSACVSRAAFMNDLAAGISSGIKNAAGVISGYVQLLPERGDDAGFRDHFTAQVSAGLERLSGLAAALAELSASADSPEEKVPLNSVLQQSIASLRSLVEKNGVILREELDPRLPQLNASRSGLARVFWNILMNACQSMPQGGDLTVASSSSGGGIKVTVQDTGCGIPHDNIAEVFRPFFTTRADGAGLGLSIARQIVESYGGSIEVTSRIHAGTAVTVFFPKE